MTLSLSLPAWQGRAFSPGLVPLSAIDDSESMVGIKPGYSGVVIWYQVDEFAFTWLEECFVALSQIYTRLMVQDVKFNSLPT